MHRLFSRIIFILTLLLLSGSATLAQEGGTKPSFDETAARPALPDILTTGPLSCFDYYHFGSVQADLVPNLNQTVPGATLTFGGKVVNGNDYPLLDGSLYVKIFKKDETVFQGGDGNPVVDQFVVADNLTLPAKGSHPVTYTWKVPANAEKGDYYAAYFFTTAKRYNLMGLSFTDDVVGNQAPFSITNDTNPKLATLSKPKTTLNGENHHFAAFPLHFKAGDTVTAKTVITNPSDTTKTVPLQWNQYAWDAMNKDNLRFTKTEVVTLKPGEQKEVSYEIQPTRESVVYVTAVTQDVEAKSILNIRYVRDGIEETRINFPGLSTFPIKAGTAATLFACAHSTNEPVVPGNTLTLTLKDRSGKTIYEYKYDGDITGAMSGFGESFTPAENISYATLTATLERSGVIVEQVIQTYDCHTIDPSSCLPEAGLGSFFDSLKAHAMIIILSLVILLLVAVIIVFLYKKRRLQRDTGSPPITTPTALLFFLLLFPAFFLSYSHVEAKSVSWNTTYTTQPLYYYWDGNIVCGWTSTPCSGWEKGLENPNVTINYYADVYNNQTNQLITDGTTVPVGTVLRFTPKTETGADISWFGIGYSQDSPNGWWVNSILPYDRSINACSAANYIGRDTTSGIDVYSPLLIKIPTKTITHSGTAGLSCNSGNSICTVTSAGSINSTVSFAATTGHFYYAYDQGGGCTMNGGVDFLGNDVPTVPMATQSVAAGAGTNSNVPYYQLNVLQQTINFNLTAAAAGNQPPAAPTITGPTTGNTNTNHQFSFTATDPDNDTLRYGVDWDNNGTVDEWLPGTGYVGSAIGRSQTRSWGSAGTYTFQALTQDSQGNSSGWSSYSITVSAPSAGDCVIPGSQDDQIIDECAMSTSGGYRIGQDFDYAFVINVSGGNSYYRVCHNKITIARGLCSVGEFVWDGDSTCQGTFPACVSTPTTDLKANTQDGPLNVPKNTTVTLNWTSANAASCSKWGGTWGSGETVGTSGSDTTVVTASTQYLINCGGVIDTVQVNVVNQTPNAPTISYVSGTLQTGQIINFSIQGTDPDNDTIFYEVDWDMDGNPDATTMTVPSNTTQPASRSWGSAGTQTFQARTVDTAGARSGWTQHRETIAAATPTATLEVSINGGGYSTNDATTDPTDTITLRWSSTNAATCTGTNFNTGNAPAGTINPGAPTPNSATTYTLACGSASDPLTITTRQRPNFTQPSITHTPGTFNTTTGMYDSITIFFQTSNNGGSDTQTNADYRLEYDRGADGFEYTNSGALGRLTVGQSVNGTEIVTGGVPLGANRVRVTVDSNNDVVETDETDNIRTLDFTVGAPDPNLSITANPTMVQGKQNSTISWTMGNPYSMTCSVYGPGMITRNFNPATDGPGGNTSAGPITAKSEYTLSCSIAGSVFTDTVTVETQGVIEEI